MLVKCRYGLVIALGGLALLVADSPSQAADWFWCRKCSAPVDVHTSQPTAMKFVTTGHPACAHCAIRFYGTCWNPAFPPDYSHCCTVAMGTPSTLFLSPQESHPAGAREDEFPKPRLKVDPVPKTDPKVDPAPKIDPKIDPVPKTDPKVDPLPKAKPKDSMGTTPRMNIIYHAYEPASPPQPIPSATPTVRWRDPE
jgi:hypothetical protein